MKRILTHLFVAVLLMLSTTSWAQLSSLEVGQIYRFKSEEAKKYKWFEVSLFSSNFPPNLVRCHSVRDFTAQQH